MGSNTPPLKFAPRLNISITRQEAVCLIEYLRRLRAAELEQFYKDIKNMARRRGWEPIHEAVPFDAPGAHGDGAARVRHDA